MDSAELYRKAAMVVACLDRKSADEVLQRLPDQQARLIRQAMVDLPDHALRDQAAAIQEFLEPDGGEASLEEISADPFASHSLAVSSVSTPDDQNHALMRLSEEVIAETIQYERVSVVAAVLSTIPGARAALVLKRFASEKRTQVLAMLGSMTRPHPEAVAAMLDCILERTASLDMHGADHARKPDALQAILRELDEPDRMAMLKDLSDKNPMLAARFGTAVDRLAERHVA